MNTEMPPTLATPQSGTDFDRDSGVDHGNPAAATDQAPQRDYGSLLRRRNRSAWLWAALAAVGINAALFMLMPHLLHSSPAEPLFDTLLPQIQIVRLKRPDSPVKRKTPRPPEPRKQHRPPQPKLNQPSLRQPRWPFEINARLPAGPNVLALSHLDTHLHNLGLDDLFAVDDLDQPLAPLTRMPPVYPLGAKRRGIEGSVTVRFVVNEQGTVEQITVVESQPPGTFDDSVIRCVRGWRFQPGTVEGQPVKAWAETTIHFELD